MKTIFQVRFLLISVVLLLLALYIQQRLPGRIGVSNSLGGPVEIAQSADYYSTLLVLLLRFFVSGLLVPCGIGLVVCAVLRRRHSGYHVSVVRPVVLSVLTWWVWGLLIVFVYKIVANSFSYSENLIFQWAALLTSIGWGIAAARFSYYQERTQQWVEGGKRSTLSSSGLSVHTPE